MPSTAELATLYAKRTRHKRELDKEIKDVQKELDDLEQQVLEAFAQDGVRSLKTAEHGTVYTKFDIWASCEDLNVLAYTEWAWLAKPHVNSQTLSALVRELEQDGEGNPILPPGAELAVKVTVKPRALVRQS